MTARSYIRVHGSFPASFRDNDMLGDAKILDKRLKRLQSDMIFAAANAEDDNIVVDDVTEGMNDANPDNALTR